MSLQQLNVGCGFSFMGLNPFINIYPARVHTSVYTNFLFMAGDLNSLQFE